MNSTPTGTKDTAESDAESAFHSRSPYARRIVSKGEEQDSQPEDATLGKHNGSCPECESPKLGFDSGELICHSCQTVIDAVDIDPGPEWRAYNSEDVKKKKRTEKLIETHHDRGLGSQISVGDGDIGEKGKPWADRWRKKLHNRVRSGDSKDRNLKYTFTQIKRLKSVLELSEQVHTLSCKLARQIYNEISLIGRSLDVVATASVYIVCRQLNIGRSLYEFKQVSNHNKNNDHLTRFVNTVRQELDIPIPPSKPSEYIYSILSALDVPDEIHSQVVALTKQVEEEGYHGTGANPKVIAATCVYVPIRETLSVGSEHFHSQGEVSEQVNVTPTSIRNHQGKIKELYNNLNMYS